MGVGGDLVLVLLVITSFTLLSSSRISIYITTLAWQGVLVGMVPLAMGWPHVTGREWVLALLTMSIKGVVFPLLLSRNVRAVKVHREIEPFVGFAASLMIGVCVLVLCFWLAGKIAPVAPMENNLVLPVALATIFVGLFLIVSRKKAITQAIGYLVFENGIWLFGIALALKVSVVLELAITMDIIAATAVLTVAIFQISRTFEHIDMDKLDGLRG